MNKILLTYSAICLAAAGIYGGLTDERRRALEDIASGDTLAWSRHITGQDVNDPSSHHYFRSVACVSGAGTTPAGDNWREDQLYVVTERIIDSNTVKYIELFTPRDWGNDPNYCWFVDCGPGDRITRYQPGRPAFSTMEPETMQLGLVMANNGYVQFFDLDYALIAAVLLSGTSTCTTIDSDSDGNLMAGVSQSVLNDSCIWRWDADGVLTKDFYQPVDPWQSVQTCLALRVTDDDSKLYALVFGQTSVLDYLYCFDNQTGAELWNVNNYDLFSLSFGMAVDSSNNVYVYYRKIGTAIGIYVYDSTGALRTNGINYYAFGDVKLGYSWTLYDIYVDEAMNRLLIAGRDTWTTPNNHLGAVNLDDGTNYDYFSIGASGSIYILGVVTDGTNVYCCGTRTESGVGGAWATVWKLNSELVLQASYDTGGGGTYLCWNDDGDLVVKDKAAEKLVVLDTDLSLVASYSYTDLSDVYGGEIVWRSKTVETEVVTPAIPEAWFTHDVNQLNGASVCVYADAIPRGTFVMDGNDIADFNEADYTIVIAGLNYYSIYESFPLAKDKTRIVNLAIDFYETLQAHVGTTRTYSNNWQFSADNFATQLDPVTEIKFGLFPRGWGNDPTVYLWIWDPVPCTIRGMYPQMEIAR